MEIVLIAECLPDKLIAGGQNQNDLDGQWNSQKSLDGMLKNGLAVEQQKLFWYVGLHPATTASGNDNGKKISR